MKKTICTLLVLVCLVSAIALVVTSPVGATDRCVDPGSTNCERPPRVVPTATPRPPRPPIWYCIPEMPCKTFPPSW